MICLNGLKRYTIMCGKIRRTIMSETFAEMLDNAENGEQFTNTIQGLFRFLEKKMEEEDED